MTANSEVTDLVRRIRAQVDTTDPQGRKFKVAKTGKHQKVLHPSGQALIDPEAGGPVILSGSPGDNRWRAMKVNQLIKLGVFKTDPYKETRSGDDDDDPRSEAQRAADAKKDRQAAKLRDRSESFRLGTQKIRAGIEPIVAKLGGWSRGGSGVKVADFAGVLRWWAERNDPTVIPLMTDGRPYATSAWQTQVTNLRTAGGTIGERWLPLFDAFLVALREGDENLDPAESSLVYLDFYRASKGIVSPTAAGEEGEREEAPTATERVVVEWPKVALEALFWMARGADGDDKDEILDLAEEIAELAATKERGVR